MQRREFQLGAELWIRIALAPVCLVHLWGVIQDAPIEMMREFGPGSSLWDRLANQALHGDQSAAWDLAQILVNEHKLLTEPLNKEIWELIERAL